MGIRKAPARRFAFLLGNAGYTHVSRLRNPLNDIDNVARELAGLGYAVTRFSDLDWSNTWFRFREFAREAGRCDAMVLYYCGHGVQLGGDNYIVPTDFNPEVPVDADTEAGVLAGLVRVQDVMHGMMQARARLIFLDACRNEGGLRQIRVRPQAATPARTAAAAGGGPQTRSLAGGPGLAKETLVDLPQTFICFAADPGDVAEDGPAGGMSPFSEAVASHISLRGLGVFDLSQRIARDVRQKTEGRQVPWTNSNLSDDFSFHPTDSRPIWILGGLGAAAGLLAAVTSTNMVASLWPPDFTDSLRLHDVIEHREYLLTSLLFGGVLGYGAWRWGKHTWTAAVLTCLLYTLVATLSRLWFAPFAKLETTQALLANLRFDEIVGAGTGCSAREVLYTIVVTTTLMGAASVFAAGPWVRDMARLPRIAMGAVIGASAALLMLVFLKGRQSVNDWLAEGSAAAVADNSAYYWLEPLAVLALFVVWHALLAINVGRAYARPVYD